MSKIEFCPNPMCGVDLSSGPEYPYCPACGKDLNRKAVKVECCNAWIFNPWVTEHEFKL